MKMGDKTMSDKSVDDIDIKTEEENSKDDSKKNTPKKVRKSLKKELFTIACIGEVLIVLMMIFFMVLTDTASQPLDMPLKSWKSDYIEFRNNAWYADETLVPTEEEVILLYGPYVEMGKGSYTVTVEYECTEEQVCYAPTNSFTDSGLGRLIPSSNTASFKVDINQGVAEFEIVVKYNGNGSLKIKNITMCEDHCRLGRSLVYAILLFAILDIWFIFEDKIRKNRTVILSLIGIVILTSIPLFTKGIGKGHDLYYHVMRIEALADSLTHGVFPNRISTLWFDGYGYPSSIYYGDILLYIPAVMRLIGFNVVTSYKIYVLSINIGTTLLGYFSFKGMFKNKYSSLLTTLVYSTATYRLVNVYIRAAVGEYTAMMFLPVICCGMYKIYTADMKDRKECLNAATILALGMTGLIGCHILSTEMAVIMLVIVCVLLFKKTLKLTTIRSLCLAIAETLILTAYFTIPFLDYYKNVKVKINDVIEENPVIQWQGCSIAEYFAVFRDVFSQYSVHANARLAATPGFILLTAVIVGVIVLIYSKKGNRSRELILYIVMTIVSLYLASDIFPWDKLAATTSIGRLLAQVQFPWRYVTMSIIFSSLVFAWLFRKFEDKDFGNKTRLLKLGAVACVALIGMASAMFFDGAYIDDIRFKEWFDGGDIDTWSIGAGEYKLGKITDSMKGEVIFDNMQTVNLIERDGTKMELYCETANHVGTVDVPILNYKGYVVTDEYGNTYDIIDGKNHTITFKIPPNYKGHITVDFKIPWYWRGSEIISLAGVIALCVIYGRAYKRKKKSLVKPE